MPVVAARSLSFHVQLLGDAAAPPLAMLHGLFIGSLATWYFTAGPRLARRHRVLLFDLRGHGRSDRPASGYDTATMAGDLESLLDWEQRATGNRQPATGYRLPAPEPGFLSPVSCLLSPVSLVGHSFGALVALRYAISHPVSRLVLVEPPLPAARAAELSAFVRLPPREMARVLPAPLREQLAAGGRAARALVERLAALATQTSILDDLAREPDPTPEELSRVTCPAHVVSGASSPLAGAGERLARALPDGRHHVLAGGHFLPTDAPESLAALLDEVCVG